MTNTFIYMFIYWFIHQFCAFHEQHFGRNIWKITFTSSTKFSKTKQIIDNKLSNSQLFSNFLSKWFFFFIFLYVVRYAVINSNHILPSFLIFTGFTQVIYAGISYSCKENNDFFIHGSYSFIIVCYDADDSFK